jgi:hypothetical protein
VPKRAKLITSPRKKRLTWRFLNPLSAVPIPSRCCRECRVSNTFQDHGKFWIGNMLVCVIPGRECMIVVVHAAIVGGADNRAKREHRAESSHGLTADCWRISALRCSSDWRRSSRSSSAGNRLGLHWGLKPPITTNVYPRQSASLAHSVRQCVCACALSQMVSPNQRSVEPVNRVPCWGGASGCCHRKRAQICVSSRPPMGERRQVPRFSSHAPIPIRGRKHTHSAIIMASNC